MVYKIKKFLPLLAALTSLVFVSGSAAAQGQYASGSLGVDLSYPNCRVQAPNASFGIIGVNGGYPYTQNGCLAAEASHYSNLSLYANSSLNADPNSVNYANAVAQCPAGDVNCAAYFYGYNAGTYAYNYAKSQGLSSSTWWLDVETSNSWSTDPIQNQQSILGEQKALTDNGVTTVGVYSTTAQWNSITNAWQNGWPSWGATTWSTPDQAKVYCTGHQFTGGPSLLMQYLPKKTHFDADVAC